MVKRELCILIPVLVVLYFAIDAWTSTNSSGEDLRFHSDQADYSLQLAEGWVYNQEVADFFAVPADGWLKGTSRFEVSQVGYGCTSEADWSKMVTDLSSSFPVPIVQPVTIAGISGIYVVQVDDSRNTASRQNFGWSQVPIVQIEFTFRHDCRAWRISLQAEKSTMDQAVPEFTAMLNSFRFDEGFFQSWLPGI